MPRLAAAAALAAGAALAAARAAPPAALQVAIAADGTFNVSVGGAVVFVAPDTAVALGSVVFRASAGTLRLLGSSSAAGVDGVGAYAATTFGWRASDAAGTAFNATIRLYDSGDRVSFTGLFPGGANADANGTAGAALGGLAAAFPALALAPGAPPLLSLAQDPRTGNCGFTVGGSPQFPAPSGGLVIMTPPLNATAAPRARFSLGLAAADQVFSVRQAVSAPGVLACGPGSDYVLPPGYAFTTVLVATTPSSASAGVAAARGMPPGGPNAAIALLGDTLLALHGKPRPTPAIDDIHAKWGWSTIGRTFYDPCDCGRFPAGVCETPGTPHSGYPASCRTYADDMAFVWRGLRDGAAGVAPPAHLLIDSFWYGENMFDGVSEWTSSPGLMAHVQSFPAGLPAFLAGLNASSRLTVWAHNGRWARSSPYVSVPAYGFKQGVPQGPALWRVLFAANAPPPPAGWSLAMIKQDHVAESMAGAGAVSDPALFATWWGGMDTAAREHGVATMFCCSPPSVLHNSITMPSATSARASPDYVHLPGDTTRDLPRVQWAVGVETAFHYWGLGLLPDKDGFFSNASETDEGGEGVPAGNAPPFWQFFEQNPVKHALYAALSWGPWAVSDGPGQTNWTLVRAFVRADGTVLRTGRPQTALDAQLRAMAGDGGAWPAVGAGAPPAAAPAAAVGGVGAGAGAGVGSTVPPLPNGDRGEAYSSSTLLPLGPPGAAAAAAASTWTLLVGSQLSAPIGVTAAELALDAAVDAGARFVAYAWSVDSLAPAGAPAPVFAPGGGNATATLAAAPDYADAPVVVGVAPLLLGGDGGAGYALLGEVGKAVPVSPQRLAYVGPAGAGAAGLVAGVTGGGADGRAEAVTLAYCRLDAATGACPVQTASGAVAPGQTLQLALA